MGIWIRTQHKTELVYTHRIVLDEYTDDFRPNDRAFLIQGYDSYENQVLFGAYETPERALEVLDEIQERINALSGTFQERIGRGGALVSYIYQMPSE